MKHLQYTLEDGTIVCGHADFDAAPVLQVDW